ncbi:MAG: PIG-L family deacetylase [Acidobacteriota bacterium]
MSDEIPRPPGHTEAPAAASVLVLAPHYDDEILGCGGLLAEWIEGGAAVRVLFLSDSAADTRPAAAAIEGKPADGAPRALATQRRQEAMRVIELLGFAGSDHLELPDGRLESHQEAIAAGVERALLAQRPDVVLAPSPLEISPDHRAAFAALHRVLHPVRPEHPLFEAVRDLRVFLYEINHPQHPDLLVDVSQRLGILDAAMAVYASQQERHDYGGAARGLRRWRTLTLPAGIEAAEAYRRLAFPDFTTRGQEALVRFLGGAIDRPPAEVEGSKISVIVRTKDRPELLAEALGSLAASTWARLEVVLVNDGGASVDVPADPPFELRSVHLETTGGRAAAANAGLAAATGDYVGFLDDDDLVDPDHHEILAGLLGAAGVRVAYTDAAVSVQALGATGWQEVERRLPYSRDFDAELLHLDNYIPLHTVLFERSLLDEVEAFDPSLPIFEDWDFLLRLAAVTPFRHLPRVTCTYRQFRDAGHHALGNRPKDRDDFFARKAEVIARHRDRLGADGLARAVDRLRAERVAAAEDRRRALAQTRAAEEREHSVRGELAAERAHRQAVERSEEQVGHRLGAALDARVAELRDIAREMRQLERELAEVRAAGEARSADLRAAYAEIERLGGVIDAMESTRAWRLHQRMSGWRGP